MEADDLSPLDENVLKQTAAKSAKLWMEPGPPMDRTTTDQKLLHLVQLDDVRMVEHLHDLNLPVDLLQVDCIQLGLVNDLDGHLQGSGSNNEDGTAKGGFVSRQAEVRPDTSVQ